MFPKNTTAFPFLLVASLIPGAALAADFPTDAAKLPVKANFHKVVQTEVPCGGAKRPGNQQYEACLRACAVSLVDRALERLAEAEPLEPVQISVTTPRDDWWETYYHYFALLRLIGSGFRARNASHSRFFRPSWFSFEAERADAVVLRGKVRLSYRLHRNAGRVNALTGRAIEQPSYVVRCESRGGMFFPHNWLVISNEQGQVLVEGRQELVSSI